MTVIITLLAILVGVGIVAYIVGILALNKHLSKLDNLLTKPTYLPTLMTTTAATSPIVTYTSTVPVAPVKAHEKPFDPREEAIHQALDKIGYDE